MRWFFFREASLVNRDIAFSPYLAKPVSLTPKFGAQGIVNNVEHPFHALDLTKNQPRKSSFGRSPPIDFSRASNIMYVYNLQRLTFVIKNITNLYFGEDNSRGMFFTFGLAVWRGPLFLIGRLARYWIRLCSTSFSLLLAMIDAKRIDRFCTRAHARVTGSGYRVVQGLAIARTALELAALRWGRLERARNSLQRRNHLSRPAFNDAGKVGPRDIGKGYAQGIESAGQSFGRALDRAEAIASAIASAIREVATEEPRLMRAAVADKVTSPLKISLDAAKQPSPPSEAKLF
jgi:hypothetical protein